MTTKAERDLREHAARRRYIELHFFPAAGHTSYALTVAEGLGSRRRVLLRWAGHLNVGIPDLAGRSAPDVTALLCGELWTDLADASTNPNTLRPKAPASPEGITGAALQDVPLPGLEPTLSLVAGLLNPQR